MKFLPNPLWFIRAKAIINYLYRLAALISGNPFYCRIFRLPNWIMGLLSPSSFSFSSFWTTSAVNFATVDLEFLPLWIWWNLLKAVFSVGTLGDLMGRFFTWKITSFSLSCHLVKLSCPYLYKVCKSLVWQFRRKLRSPFLKKYHSLRCERSM